MPIYEKPTKTLMREWATGDLVNGQEFSKDKVSQWFRTNYPLIKAGTVDMHVEAMSTNNGTIRQHHKSVRPGTGHDLFFKLGRNRFRLFDPEIDPAPIYDTANDDSATSSPSDAETIEELARQIDPVTLRAATEFAYERDLQNFLVKNLSRLEPGLRLYVDEDGLSGVEFNAGGRRIDILAVDSEDRLVVIELKVSNAYDRVVGQIARYMAWITANLEPEKPVRGMIVAKTINEDLKLACSMIADVKLLEYEMTFEIRLLK